MSFIINDKLFETPAPGRSINLYEAGRKVVCIKNLSEKANLIKESYTEDNFPYIGKTYIVSSCRGVHRNRPFQLTFYEFEMNLDIMRQPHTFRSTWFVPEKVAYSVLLASNINIRQIGYKEQIQMIYDKGLWKPKTKAQYSHIGKA